MVVRLGAQKPQTFQPNPTKDTSTEVKPPETAPAPGFRTQAPSNMAGQRPPVDLAASAAAYRSQVKALQEVGKEVDGAVTILNTEFKRNAANAGKIDTVALSNALNQLLATQKKLRTIIATVGS